MGGDTRTFNCVYMLMTSAGGHVSGKLTFLTGGLRLLLMMTKSVLAMGRQGEGEGAVKRYLLD